MKDPTAYLAVASFLWHVLAAARRLWRLRRRLRALFGKLCVTVAIARRTTSTSFSRHTGSCEACVSAKTASRTATGGDLGGHNGHSAVGPTSTSGDDVRPLPAAPTTKTNDTDNKTNDKSTAVNEHRGKKARRRRTADANVALILLPPSYTSGAAAAAAPADTSGANSDQTNKTDDKTKSKSKSKKSDTKSKNSHKAVNNGKSDQTKKAKKSSKTDNRR